MAAGQKLPGGGGERVVHSPRSALESPLLFKAPLETTWSNGFTIGTKANIVFTVLVLILSLKAF